MVAPIQFTVSIPDPNSHLFHVRMEIYGLADVAHVDVRLPAWSPGSYLVREYARHVQNVRASCEQGGRRSTRKLDKATWRVDCSHADQIVVEYEVFAHDLTVRTNHLDDTHGFFNGVALFMHPVGRLNDAVDIEVVPPQGWGVYCGLKSVERNENRFSAHSFILHARNFDELYDCPVETGPYDPIDFMVEDKPHRILIWGDGNYDRDVLAKDFAKIVATNARMFGGLPYDDYLFIVHLTDNGFGGLEHSNSTVLQFSRHGFADSWTKRSAATKPDGMYLEFLRLVSHEHFHVWNVKRIRPAVLGPFDYQQENYTRELWSIEGVTSYYDTLLLLRGGIIDGPKYLELMARRIKLYQEVPGRYLHSLEDASFDAWIKLYRPDEHTNNSSVSYYLKGELVCWLLDLWMRTVSNGSKSLDDVLRKLWMDYQTDPAVGYAEGAYEQLVSEIVGVDAGDFFDRYVRGTETINWNEFLEPFGLCLKPIFNDGRPKASLGFSTRSAGDRMNIVFVPSGSPAHQAGLYAGDELVAVDGWRVSATGYESFIQCLLPGDTVSVHVFRRGQLLMRQVTLGEGYADSYQFCRTDIESERALELLRGWLGTADVGCVGATMS